MELMVASADDYRCVMNDLLPPGQAWQWPAGGFGASMLDGTCAEPVRLDADIRAVLDAAIDTHRPAVSNWRIDEYRRVGAAAVASEQAAAPGVEILRIDHLIKPFCVGAKVGALVWSSRSRYILRVRYSAAHIDPDDGLRAALDAFKQAHVFLWMEAV